MDTTTPIGLNAEAAAQLSAGLNDLLADLTVFYMNARGFHWNIRGKEFFELHLLKYRYLLYRHFLLYIFLH